MVSTKRIEQLEQQKDAIVKIINDNQMSNAEAAATLLTVMQNILAQPHNVARLSQMGLNVEELTINQILAMQEVWADTYFKEVKVSQQ